MRIAVYIPISFVYTQYLKLSQVPCLSMRLQFTVSFPFILLFPNEPIKYAILVTNGKALAPMLSQAIEFHRCISINLFQPRTHMVAPIWPTSAIVRATTYAFTTHRSVVVLRMNTPSSANSKYTFPSCRMTICASGVLRNDLQRV